MKKTITILILTLLTTLNLTAQNFTTFKSFGTFDQYVPVVFKNVRDSDNAIKPINISRPYIHADRQWLAHGTATISGIGFGWGSGGSSLVVNNSTFGIENATGFGATISFVGRVVCDWSGNDIIVFLRGGTTYSTDGTISRNDGLFKDLAGQQNFTPVSILDPLYNIPKGNYYSDFDINKNSVVFSTLANGKVGIGTTNPKEKLEVSGNLLVNSNSSYSSIRLGQDDNNAIISDNAGDNYYGGGYFFRVHNPNVTNKYTDAILITEAGSVGIGAKPSTNFNFEVAGKSNFRDNISVNAKLEAKEIKVTLTPTADFVFEENYHLPSLESIEKHIKDKKHLPEIASAKEMEKEGVNVGEFQIKLLQKIEELTLYMIEMKKEVSSLKNDNNELKNQINLFKTTK
jgi:hypothetical protein